MPTNLVTAPRTLTGRDIYRFSTDQYQRLLDAGLVTAAEEADVLAGRQRFSVGQYHTLDGLGILSPDDRVELLDGLLLWRPIINPPHANTVRRVGRRLNALPLSGWTVREQVPVTLPTSQPHPDVCVARGPEEQYDLRHPGTADLGLVVEVADSSLDYDRGGKAALYAAAGIVEYWIVNLIDGQVEVYTQPTPAGYASTQVYLPGQGIPLVLDSVAVGAIAVDDLLP